MDDGTPSLEVGFAIDTGGSFDELIQLQTMMDSAEVRLVADAASIERATAGMVNVAGATASIRAFGNAATREAQAAAREISKVEKSGEALSRQMERQASVFGKTREEIRRAKVETAALAAEQQGLTELAARLRSQEAELFAQEYAAARRARQEAEDTAEAKELAATQARAASEAEALAVREAADAYRLFEAVAKQKSAQSRDRQAIEAKDAAEAEARAVREAADAYRMFEAVARQKSSDYRLRQADEAKASAEGLAAEQRRAAEASRAAADATREAAAAQAAQEASLHSLRGAVDPLYGAQQRLSNELENAVRLYRSGAIGQEEYERSSASLASRLDEVQKAQARQADGVDDLTNRTKLSASDLTNIAFQVQDIIISIAGGQKIMLVAMQQGAQLGGIMMQTGATVGDMIRAIIGLAIVSTPAAAAVTALTEAEAAQAAAQVAAASTGSAAAIASAELAVANEAATAAAAHHAVVQQTLVAAQAQAAAAAAGDAAAQAALAAAQAAVATSGAELAAAQAAVVGAETAAAGAAQLASAAATRLAAAQAAAAAASEAAAASATMALAPWLAVLLPIAAGLALVAGGVKLLQNEANEGEKIKKYAGSLGLTAKEIRNLDDVTVTFGDTTAAVFQVAGRAIWDGIGPAVSGVWKVMKEWLAWIGSAAKAYANFMIGYYVGAYNTITKTWRQFPAVLGDAFLSTVNSSIDAINFMVLKAVEGLNWLHSQVNRIMPKELQLPTLSAFQIGHVDNQFAGAGKKFGETLNGEMSKAMGKDYLGDFASAVVDQARKNARDRIRKQAEEKGYLDPEKGKVDRIGRETQAIEAQIRNLYALADAYKISGAAALIAEARVKAESDAIKKGADVEMRVNQQVRLAIAQRVVDAAKSTASMREQADAQAEVNAMVTASLVPADRAAELVKAQIADLPLIAALQAAQQRGLATEAEKATQALADQRGERERLRAAEETARFNTDMAGGANRLAELREELRLVGAADAVRTHALATLKATQEAEARFTDPAKRQQYIAQQVQISDEAERLAASQRDYNDALSFAADRWDLIARNIQNAAQGMTDAFGDVGGAIGDMAAIYASYEAQRARAEEAHKERLLQAGTVAARDREVARYLLSTSTAQIGAYGDMAAAAKGFFGEGSKGYAALATAEKAFRAVEFALSVRAMAQDAAETASSIANSVARAAKHAVEAVAKAISSLPFPANLAAGAATVAALASIGLSIAGSFGGGGKKPEPTNQGTGTVLGDASAKSDSLKRSIDALRAVDMLTNNYARDMSASLKSIDSQIGGFAALVVRAGNVNASGGITEGFKSDSTGKVLQGLVTGGGLFTKIPVLGGIISGIGSLVGSLFGSSTKVVGSGLYGGSQSVGSILNGGFDAKYYSEIEKTKKFFGIKTGKSYSTQFSDADQALEQQFTLILRSFSDAIKASAGPLGLATSDIEARLNGFVVNIGKIDLKGLTGEQIQEKLTAVFGAAADGMANAAFPGLAQFQKVGEGAFETLVRVASALEAVSGTLDLLGHSAQGMSIATKLALADQFDSVSDLTSAAQAYFEAFYTKEEQAAAKAAQLGNVFASLGVAMPNSLAGFRALVEAQDLTTAAGQATYATLLKLAPAFADLQSALEGAKTAAEILSERQDLQRQLLEMQGNRGALRELELAKLDESNRALQRQIWAIQDAQEAAKAAEELREAWKSVGDSIMDEVKRIRGISDTAGDGSFASLMGQFNAATAAARAGDQEAAKSLPGLSKALLDAAALMATSRQELDRVQAQTAASLEATYAAIQAAAKSSDSAKATEALLAAAATSQTASSPAAANDDLVTEVKALRTEVSQLRSENNQGHAATAGNTGAIKRKLDDVSAQSGGEAISMVVAA